MNHKGLCCKDKWLGKKNRRLIEKYRQWEAVFSVVSGEHSGNMAAAQDICSHNRKKAIAISLLPTSPTPMSTKNTASFPPIYVTVDCVVFGFDDSDLKLLLIQRGIEPFKNSWALPGGFVLQKESVDEAARRELLEETGVENVFLEQLYTFGTVERDPRSRIVSVAYYALVRKELFAISARTDAKDARWFSLNEVPKLAFDHAEIVETAIKRLRGKIRYQPIGFELLPQKFTLSQLQHLYEVILDEQIDKRNFRKKILGMDILKALDEYESGKANRPAQLFSFNRKRYEQLSKKGFLFEL